MSDILTKTFAWSLHSSMEVRYCQPHPRDGMKRWNKFFQNFSLCQDDTELVLKRKIKGKESSWGLGAAFVLLTGSWFIDNREKTILSFCGVRTIVCMLCATNYEMREGLLSPQWYSFQIYLISKSVYLILNCQFIDYDGENAGTRTTFMRGHYFTPFAQKWSADSKYTQIIALRALIRELLINLSALDLCAPNENQCHFYAGSQQLVSACGAELWMKFPYLIKSFLKLNVYN